MRGLRFLGIAIVTLGLAVGAQAATTSNAKELLRTWFAGSEHVSFVEVSRGELEARLGARAPKDKYAVFVAKTGDHVDGYAVIDDERGEHEPISFGIQLSADGRVQQAEVLTYREQYGFEIKEPRFRRQFVGKGAGDGLKVGGDVVAVSGATISSRAMTTCVQRAIALVDVVRAQNH